MTKDKKTERLVASAYEHLHPSTSVEDAVLAELTTQRDAARMTSRMWAGVAAAALLGAALMFALAYRGGPETVVDENIRLAGPGALPGVNDPGQAVGQDEPSASTSRCRQKGQLTWKTDIRNAKPMRLGR